MLLPALTFLVAVAPVAAAPELPPEPAIPDPLTLAEALALFRAHGLDLLIAEAAAEGAAGDAMAAGAIQNPSVTGGYYHSFFSDSVPFSSHNGWFVGVGDSNAIIDTLSGKRGLRRSVADAALAAARLGRADALRTLELQVKEAYFQAVAAGAALEFAHETAESTTHTFDLNRDPLQERRHLRGRPLAHRDGEAGGGAGGRCVDAGAPRRQGAAGVSPRTASRLQRLRH